MEDVVLIKAAAVAPNTSNSLDLVEAQGSHLRETIRCLPRRLALLGHNPVFGKGSLLLSIRTQQKCACSQFPFTWQVLPVKFGTPRIWCWLWATQVWKMILTYWVWYVFKTHQRGKILTRHRKRVPGATYPSQTPKGHDTRSTKKPSQGQKTLVPLRHWGKCYRPSCWSPQLHLLPTGVILLDISLGEILQSWEIPPCTNRSLKVWLCDEGPALSLLLTDVSRSLHRECNLSFPIKQSAAWSNNFLNTSSRLTLPRNFPGLQASEKTWILYHSREDPGQARPGHSPLRLYIFPSFTQRCDAWC